jgi:hypothetical protein
MAWLRIKVRPGEGVRGYSLFVDGMPLTLGPGHFGQARCQGRCGDGSRHALLYSYNGLPGATLSVILWCGRREVCRVAAPPVPLDGLRKAGRELFDL